MYKFQQKHIRAASTNHINNKVQTQNQVLLPNLYFLCLHLSSSLPLPFFI